MLSKKYRLFHKKDFERVFKQGKFISEKFLALKYFKNSLKESRFGIIVSQKVSKKSNKRDIIKRRIREVLKKNIKEIKNGYDTVILTKPEIIDKDYQKIEEVTESLFKKAKLF